MQPLQTKFSVALVVGLLLLPEISTAASEFASFESFYHESSSIKWIFAAVAAVVLGAIIFFTGGTASPIVAGMGTWVGGLMGYSGIAATNAGLALLGGGSIASGGYGMIGGIALLTAAFSFGTEVVIDYTAGKALNIYDYSKFVEGSKKMTTLPLPKNTSGPDSYEAGMKVLESIDADEALSGNKNQAIIGKAIKTIIGETDNKLAPELKAREKSLLALLYFISNDYVLAKKYADTAYRLALTTNVLATLPAFIYATSTLYEEKVDFNRATEFFNYSVTNEIDNPITPLLFAIYLDRMMYRFNDGYLTSAALNKIYSLSSSLPYDERKAAIQMGLLSRYFIRIKLSQQKILSLTGTSNKTIKESPKTLLAVQQELKEYKLLLAGTRAAISQQSFILRGRLQNDSGFFNSVMLGSVKGWETQWNTKIGEMNALWSSYSMGVPGLEKVIRELEDYQTNLEQTRLGKLKPELMSQVQRAAWWPYVSMIVVLLLIGFYLVRRRVAR